MKTAETHNNDLPLYPLRQIYFYLTQGCNLRCRHCWLAPKYQDQDHRYPMLPRHLFSHIVQQARPLGLSGVKLTGGEPLMHPDISAILSIVRDSGLGLMIETNGLLLTKTMAEEIATCNDPLVSVSLDGVDVATHDRVRGVVGSFEKAVAGLAHLRDCGVRSQVIMSVMRMNKEQMEPMIRLGESLGVSSVKFNLIQPIKRGECLHRQGETLTIEEMVALGRTVEQTLSGQTPLRIDYDHPMAFRPLGKLFGETGDGCSACGILGILGVIPDGSYALCGIGMTLPEMVFGHGEADALKTVWENTAVLNDLRQGMSHRLEGICGRCLMQHLCLGGCVAQNVHSGGHIWHPFWYCDAAYRKGLFPATRLR